MERREEGIAMLRLALQLGVSDYILKGNDNFLEILNLTVQKILLQKTQESAIYPVIKTGQVFIACPFDEHHNQIYEKLRQNGSPFKFIRADDKFRSDYLKEIIYDQIAESEFLIAFISGLNSNVMYELGLAHGIGRKVLIVKDDQTDIISDLRGLIYLLYKRDAPFEVIDKILKALKDFSPEL